VRVRRGALVVVTAVATALATVSGAVAGPPPEPSPPPAATLEGDLQATLTGTAAEILQWINIRRAELGAPPLREDAALTQFAQAWAEHSARIGELAPNPSFPSGLPDGYMGAAEFSSYTGFGVYWYMLLRDLQWQAPVSMAPGYTHVGIGFSRRNASDYSGTLYLVVTKYRFRDVGPAEPFFADIEWMGANSISLGNADGTFWPSSAITRGALAAFLYRVNHPGADPNPPCTGVDRRFSDVPITNQFCGAIEWLATSGITSGFPDGTFRPEEPISREAMAAFLYRDVVGEREPACTPGARRFSDVGADNPFCSAIEWLATSRITTGWPDGTFRPAASIQRQAVAAFFHRLASLA